MSALENYNVVSDIKACLLEDILTDDKAVKLIKHQKNVTLPGLDLRYTQVFPWRKMLGTQEEARTLVTCEVDIPDVVTSATRIYRLKIFVIVPENQMRLDDKAGEMLGIEDRGSKLDVLCDRIDYLINGSKRYTYVFGSQRLEKSKVETAATEKRAKSVSFRWFIQFLRLRRI